MNLIWEKQQEVQGYCHRVRVTISKGENTCFWLQMTALKHLIISTTSIEYFVEQQLHAKCKYMQFLQLYQFIYCFDEEKSVISMDTLSITDLL